MHFSAAWRTMAVTGLALFLASGCASHHSKPAPQAATISPDSYGAIKAAYLSANPNARVGRVAAVQSPRLDVEDIPLTDFRKGDVVSIVDAKMALLATGEVTAIDSGYLYVEFEPSAGAPRAPAEGDLAIRAETPTR